MMGPLMEDSIGNVKKLTHILEWWVDNVNAYQRSGSSYIAGTPHRLLLSAMQPRSLQWRSTARLLI